MSSGAQLTTSYTTIPSVDLIVLVYTFYIKFKHTIQYLKTFIENKINSTTWRTSNFIQRNKYKTINIILVCMVDNLFK
jgi:hypothetical protein